MSNEIIESINKAAEFRTKLKTKNIQSPNNEAYEKLLYGEQKEHYSKGGFIPPTKYELGEILYDEDDILYKTPIER